MRNIKTTAGIKKVGRIVLRSILGLLLFLLLCGIALSLPVVQTQLGQWATQRINKDYKTDISIDKVVVSAFGSIKLKTVMIRDHHKDTLVYASRIQTNILSFRQLYNGDLLFGDIRVDGLLFDMRIHKGERDTNLDHFIRLFDSGKKSTKKFLMKAENVYVTNSRFMMNDENLTTTKNLDFKNVNALMQNLKLHGPEVTMAIKRMAFRDHRGLQVKNLITDFTYTRKNIFLKKTDLQTEHSYFKGDVGLHYIREDFQDFNNKVRFDIAIASASIATNEIYYFYKELGRDRQFNIKSNLTGTLNNFTANQLELTDDRKTEIIGNVNFRNLLGKKDQGFYMKGNFSKIASDYKNLTGLLPNILGKKLPTTLAKLGHFNLRGKAVITTNDIDADFYMTTALGNLQTDLVMTNIQNIDNAAYTGNIILENFNIGRLLGRTDLGTVSLNLDVDGRGFNQKYLNTTMSGDIYRINYNGYNYSNIAVNGKFKKPIFQGKMVINDPNLLMDFEGMVNLGKKDMQYDFHTKIDYADLVKLKIVKKDTVSIFKGDVRAQVVGNNIDNMYGNIYISQTSYQNSKDTYLFDDFTIASVFDENRVRTITINSPDIIEGKVTGKFEFSQVPKMVQNSLGSLYANYSPNKIKKGHLPA